MAVIADWLQPLIDGPPYALAAHSIEVVKAANAQHGLPSARSRRIAAGRAQPLALSRLRASYSCLVYEGMKPTRVTVKRLDKSVLAP